MPDYSETESFETWSGRADYPYNFEAKSDLTFYTTCSGEGFYCRDYRIEESYASTPYLTGNALYLNAYTTSARRYGFTFPNSRSINFIKMRIAATYRDLFNAKVEVFFSNGTSEIKAIEDIEHNYSSYDLNFTDFSIRSNENIEKIEIQSNETLYLDNLTWGYNSEPIDKEPPTWPNYPYTDIRVTNITRYYFEVLWPAANDNVNVAGYYFYLNGSRVATYERVNENNSIFLDGLARNSTYELEIIAYDDTGNLSTQNPVKTVQTSP